MMIPAHVKYILLSILFVLASVNFTRTALEIIDNSKRLDDLSQEIAGLKDEKSSLEESVTYKQTDEYIEEKARNELSLIKPGEKVYVIPDELKNTSANDKTLNDVSLKTHLAEGSNDTLSQWLTLVFH